MKRVMLAIVAGVLLVWPGLARAQGLQTGIITGTVRSADGLSLPGVTVTVSSPALQGARTSTTDVNGVYFAKGLPPGTYTVNFEIPSFASVKKDNIEVSVGATVDVSQTMALAGVSETVTVEGVTPTPLAVPVLSQAYGKKDVDVLPVGRIPNQVADLAPGLTSNTPNAGQVTISGATAYDNVFMVNGVDVNDNLFGTANNLFVEDAIEETNILTGGISAEYGRFAGGVINVVTKSGGNTFSGSFRENLSNPKWITETPRQVANHLTNPDILGKASEGTLGGPIMRDRLWFFGSARYEKAPQAITFYLSPQQTTRTDINKRGDIKLTGSPWVGHTFSMDYTNNSTAQNGRFSLNANSLDPTVLINETQPNTLFVTNYNGVIGNRLFATFQYSQKKFRFENAGGTATDITGSPIRTRGLTPGVPSGYLYGAPYFSAYDPEDRNNRQFTGSLAYTLSTKRIGTHDIKGGGEYYRSTRTGGNSQSSTGYVFLTDYLPSAGKPVYDSSGVPVPVWTPGVTQLQNWLSTVGAFININTLSLYAQDHWVVSPNLTLDLGTRFENVKTLATGDIVSVNNNRFVPRLGATYDLKGNGETVVQATYAHYSGKYSEAQFAVNTNVGTPSRVTYLYGGPPGQGRDFAPAYNLANYTSIVSASFPTSNIFVTPDFSSPIVKEFTTSLGRQVGRKGFVKGTFQWRRYYNFVEDYIRYSDGSVNVTYNGKPVTTLNKVIYGNTDNVDREYQGLVLQSSYRLSPDITFGAHYTLQIKNQGNSNAEAANQPGLSSPFGDYPEIEGPALDRYMPEGNLVDYQKHKLRVYGNYTQRLGRFGSIDIAPIWRVDSGSTFSYSAASVPLSAIELARNPGYPAANINANTTTTLFFGDRGIGDFAGYGVVDLAATYSIPIWKTARPWLKFEVYNVLNNQKLIRWDTTVTVDKTSPLDANGLPTGYIKGANFGTATADTFSGLPAYPQPIPGTNGGRMWRMAFGIRF